MKDNGAHGAHGVRGSGWRVLIVGLVGVAVAACTGTGDDAGEVAEEVVTVPAQDVDAPEELVEAQDEAEVADDGESEVDESEAESDGGTGDDDGDADPYAVPEDPDLAYWQAVIDALFAVDDEQWRAFVAGDGVVTPETETWVAATVRPDSTDAALERLRTLRLKDEESLRENFFAVPPGDVVPMVRSVVHDEAFPECVVLEVEKDLSARFASGTSSRTFWEYTTLVPKADGVPNGELNPTPWQYRGRQANDDETQIADFEAERGPLCEP